MKTRTHSRSRILGALILLAAFLQVFVWSPRKIQILQHKKQAHHHLILQQFQQQQQKKKNSPAASHYSWNETYVLPPPPPPPTQWLPTFFWTEDSTTSLPSWLVSYMEWHKEQRAQLLVLSNNESTTTTTRNEFKFLILTCRDPVCGGVSDRLKSVPLLLQLAELYHRIFLIHWERPAPLEYFVMPHQLDWRLPLEQAGPSYRSVTRLLSGLEDSDDVPVVHVTLQDQHGGSRWYNQIEHYRQQQVSPQDMRSLLSSSNVSMENTSRHFRDHFRSIWSALFGPSPWLATAIQQRQSELGLSDSNMTYVAAHVRALYRPTQRQRYGAWAMHAVQCASALRPDVPVILLSDSMQVAQAALEYAHSSSAPRNSTIRVVVPPHEVVHLDQPGPLQEHMDTFVDLYIMTHAQCISHGRGGYGRLGVLLSRNASCFFNYYQAGKTVLCDA